MFNELPFFYIDDSPSSSFLPSSKASVIYKKYFSNSSCSQQISALSICLFMRNVASLKLCNSITTIECSGIAWNEAQVSTLK